MEQGPVLILTFSAQQTMCAVDARGKVIEGGEVWTSDGGDYDGGCVGSDGAVDSDYGDDDVLVMVIMIVMKVVIVVMMIITMLWWWWWWWVWWWCVGNDDDYD